MNSKDEASLDEFLQGLSLQSIRPEEFPGIDLYMDQVTTFMETQLNGSRRSEEDKILTKTMINNYAKNNLFPSPKKKRYSRAHLYLLVFIYFFKGFLSLRDIQKILNPVTQRYFEGEKGKDMSYIYSEIYGMEVRQQEQIREDILQHMQGIRSCFQDADESEKELLQRFSLICSLSYDVYLKKRLIESLIDQMPQENPKGQKG